MKRISLFSSIIKLFFLLFIFAFFGCVSAQSGDFDMVCDCSEELCFFDDFSGSQLDSAKWEKCPEWERQGQMENHGWWNDECVYVENDNLVIECKLDKSKNRFISGAVRTVSKNGNPLFLHKYGKYEIKFKIDKTSGLWYAFWIMANMNENSVGHGAVDGAEIDCFEILPGLSNWNRNGVYGLYDGRMVSTIHWDGYNANHKAKGVDGICVEDFDSDFYDKWHIFEFIWSRNGYEAILDGKSLWIMDGDDFGGTCNAAGYMKISAEFGNWGGDVDSDILNGQSKRMLVDYVKIYRINDN